LNSNEQFPTLSNIGSSQSSKQQQQNKTIWGQWGQKSNKELVRRKCKNFESKFNSIQFAPRADGTDSSGKKSEDPKRPKFIASPECWPEHMQEKLKARELGLPDPDPIVPPHWLNQPKKEKKRKVPLYNPTNYKYQMLFRLKQFPLRQRIVWPPLMGLTWSHHRLNSTHWPPMMRAAKRTAPKTK
jgi:hypothetical protein